MLLSEKKQLKKISGQFTKKHIFKSTQSEALVGKKKIENAIETGGGVVQALDLAPGITVEGNTAISGLGRDEITLRGIKVGWNSLNYNPISNGITILFDGIPISNLDGGSGGWDSNDFPIGQFFSGINVVYGPGNPNSRWVFSLGGTINFVPIQPTMQPYNKTNISVGSYDTYTFDDEMSTGMHDGWDGVIGAGYTSANTYRTGQFNAPGQGYSFFGKVVKIFNGNSFSFGLFSSRVKQYRPNMIPETAAQGVTLEGEDANAPLYSQQTSGFYSSLPQNVWDKYTQYETIMPYIKLNLNLSSNLTFNSECQVRNKSAPPGRCKSAPVI